MNKYVSSLQPIRVITTLLLCLTCFIAETFANDLSVIVLQKGTGDPIEGATVVLKANKAYTTTNQDGLASFELLRPVSNEKLDNLKVLNQGYHTLEEIIEPNLKTITFYLSPNLVALEGLEVVENRTVEKVSKVILSAKELRGAAGTQGDPIKALQSLPGVVASNGSSSGQVYMRGSDSRENIYWANNLPVSYLYHWGGLNSVLNPTLVSDFNVFLGGFPVEYGDFLGGAVDIKLRAPKKDRLHTSLHLGTYESSFLIEGPITENNSFYLAARRSYIDLLFSPSSLSKLAGGDGKNQLVLIPQFYDMQALYRHETDKGYVDFQYFNAGDKVELLLNDAAIRDPDLVGAFKIDLKSETYGLNWEQQWNSSLSQHVTAGVVNSSQYLQVGTDPYGSPYFTNIVSHNYFIRPSLDWQHHENATTTFGIDLGKIDLPIELYISAPPDNNTPPTPGGFTSQPKYKVKRNVTATNYAPYIKQQHQWNDKLKTSVGLRYTSTWADQSKNIPIYKEQAFSPRLNVEYQLNDDTLLLASWGDYFQRPRGFQQLAEFGNPTLRFTRAEHRILGVDRKLSDIWDLKVEVYHKPMRDLIVSIQNSGPPDNYLNQGKGSAYGLDIFLKRKYENRKLGWFSYSYARSKRTNQNTGITSIFSGDQPHTFTAVWGQPFTDNEGNDSPWDWGIKLQAHSGLPYTPVVGRVQETGTGRWLPVYGGYNSSRLPMYAKLDVRFSKDVLYDTWKIKYVFDIQNVTFRQNISDFDYADDFSNYANPDVVSSDIFLPFFGIEAEF